MSDGISPTVGRNVEHGNANGNALLVEGSVNISTSGPEF